MINDQMSLVQFEQERKRLNIIPTIGANTFYDIGDGKINIFSIKDDSEECKLNLYTESGSIYTGPGVFEISKDDSSVYESLFIIKDTKLFVNQMLKFSNGHGEIYGSLELMEYSQLVINNNSDVIIYPNSEITINSNSSINIETGSSLTIYGKINIHLSQVNKFLNTPSIIIDSAAVMNVTGTEDLGKRPLSLIDYDMQLRDKKINIHTQGETNTEYGRIGYYCINGNPKTNSQLLNMQILYGNIPLGDFKYSVLGTPSNLPENLQVARQLIVEKEAVLHITELFDDYRYIHPNLYLGRIIGNCAVPAECIVKGSIVISGSNSSITIDRNASLHILEGSKVIVTDGASILNTHNEPDKEVLFIDGELYIDDISQIESFEHGNIRIGDKGRIIIMNPNNGKPKTLLSIPNRFKESTLYRLFGSPNRLDKVIYHITENTGIVIDQDFDFYQREMDSWYGSMSLSSAVKNGLIVWHNNGFIELDQSIIPWVNADSTLYDASRIFIDNSDKQKRLQQCVDHVMESGFGNIRFQLMYPEGSHSIMLNLKGIRAMNIVNQPLSDTYVITTSDSGKLFIKNNVSNIKRDKIISDESKCIELNEGKTLFNL